MEYNSTKSCMTEKTALFSKSLPTLSVNINSELKKGGGFPMPHKDLKTKREMIFDF